MLLWKKRRSSNAQKRKLSIDNKVTSFFIPRKCSQQIFLDETHQLFILKFVEVRKVELVLNRALNPYLLYETFSILQRYAHHLVCSTA
jgi:hypothetical protein